MRAFMVHEFGAPGSVGDRPTPEPGQGQILVRIRAASLNAMDPLVRGGFLKGFMEHHFPLTPGFDYAGTVAAVGAGVEGIAVGDEVFGALGKSEVGDGSFAEYATAIGALAAKRPASLPVAQAAALPLAGSTALAAVDALAGNEGDTIAVIGAAGGVGSFTTEIAARRGYRVIAVTRGEHADYVRALGAAEVVDYTAGDTLEQLRALAPEGLVGIIDLFHDAGGAAQLAAAVRPGGRVLSPVGTGLAEALADGPVSGHKVWAAPGRAGELGEMAAQGLITVPVETLPLARAAEAIDRQASHGLRGKLGLVID